MNSLPLSVSIPMSGIRQYKYVEVGPRSIATTMRDEVRLDEAWAHIVLFRERADRYLVLEQ
jgi:hypothetical protein